MVLRDNELTTFWCSYTVSFSFTAVFANSFLHGVEIFFSRQNAYGKPVKRSGQIVLIGSETVAVCHGMSATDI